MSGPRKEAADLNDLSDDERRVERLLAALPPRESRLKRDETMFQAGRASAAVDSRQRRLHRWMLPVSTICSAAAGLVIGILISASSRHPPFVSTTPSAHEDVARSSQPATEQVERGADVAADGSPTLLDFRLRMLNRGGEEFLLAQADVLPKVETPAATRARAKQPPVPATYGAFIGHLSELEEHQ